MDDGVVDKRGRTVESKPGKKDGGKPGEAQEFLQRINNIGRLPVIPAIEGIIWASTNFFRGKNYKKLMSLTTGISAEDGKAAIAQGTRYDVIDTRDRTINQLRRLRDDINKTKGNVTLLMQNSGSRTNMILRGAQGVTLALDCLARTGFTLAGTLSTLNIIGQYTGGVFLAAAIHKLRNRTSELTNEAMIKKLLAELDIQLSVVTDALTDLIKAGEAAQAAGHAAPRAAPAAIPAPPPTNNP